MDARKYVDDLDGIRAALKRQQWVSIACLAGLIIALLNMYNQFGRERTIVVPPTLERSFWVSGGAASTEYLEQMSVWAASLVLDVSPSTVQYKNAKLLEFVAPSAHGAIKEAGELAAKRIKRDNASTMFAIEKISTDLERLASVLSGKLDTYINGQRVTTVTRHYLVRYRMSSGRAYITEFSEVDNGDLNAALKTR